MEYDSITYSLVFLMGTPMFYRQVLQTYLTSKTVRECAAKMKITPGKVRWIVAFVMSELDAETASKVPLLPF